MKHKQKIAILGAGESGVGTAILAKTKNYEVFVSDAGKIKENYTKNLLVKAITDNKTGCRRYKEDFHSRKGDD